MVVDEIQSGAGRTGKWWAIEHSGRATGYCLHGKGHCVGHAAGYCLSKAEVMDWLPGTQARTLGGNPLSLAAALATIEINEREAMAECSDS